MAKQTLAVKYRPKTFDDLCEQSSIKDILTNQITTKTFQHAYLFTGPAGTGKTTSARIFASMINDGIGNPIEVDAASNSGVDNIRHIIEDSKRKPLDAPYKIFIIDECHSLSNGAWQAMLKLLEEPPKFSIFILCTTDPQKIPATILSRVQRYQFNKISTDGIVARLQNILDKESEEFCEVKGNDFGNFEEYLAEGGYDSDNEALHYIAKLAAGGMRDAITMLDKCLSLSHELTLENVLSALGVEDYGTFFELLGKLNSGDSTCVSIIDSVFDTGKDVKQFMADFRRFILDCEKYIIFKSTEVIGIPGTDEYIEMLDNLDTEATFSTLEMVLELHNLLKWDNDAKTMIELKFISYCGV